MFCVCGVVGVSVYGAVHSVGVVCTQCCAAFNCGVVGDWVVGPCVHCVFVGGGVVM